MPLSVMNQDIGWLTFPRRSGCKRRIRAASVLELMIEDNLESAFVVTIVRIYVGVLQTLWSGKTWVSDSSQ